MVRSLGNEKAHTSAKDQCEEPADENGPNSLANPFDRQRENGEERRETLKAEPRFALARV